MRIKWKIIEMRNDKEILFKCQCLTLLNAQMCVMLEYHRDDKVNIQVLHISENKYLLKSAQNFTKYRFFISNNLIFI
jgi:hypothetical protein